MPAGRTVGGRAYLSLAAGHLLQCQFDGFELGGQRVHRLVRHVALLVQPIGLRKQHVTTASQQHVTTACQQLS